MTVHYSDASGVNQPKNDNEILVSHFRYLISVMSYITKHNSIGTVA